MLDLTPLKSSGNPGRAAQQRVRLILADDHQGVLEEVVGLLSPEFDILRTVDRGTALMVAVEELRPDAVIADVEMPELGGIEAGEQILRLGLCDAVVVLTMHNEANLVKRALQAGIRGYVLKVDAAEELIAAIHAVVDGGKYLSRGVSRAGDPLGI
jgi:DNA-binding NarL/FixJ family response regulator